MLVSHVHVNKRIGRAFISMRKVFRGGIEAGYKMCICGFVLFCFESFSQNSGAATQNYEFLTLSSDSVHRTNWSNLFDEHACTIEQCEPFLDH